MSFVDSTGPARAFTLAVLGSALTAATMTTAFALGELTEIGAAGITVFFVLSLVVSTAVIAVAAILIGLPLTFLLSETDSEEAWTYPAAGLFAGGAIAILFDRFVLADLQALADLIARVAPFGAVPGGVCGALWWRLNRRHAVAPGS